MDVRGDEVLRSLKSYFIGLIGALVALTPIYAPIAARAGHSNESCSPWTYTEMSRENATTAEQGIRGQIETESPTGGPATEIVKVLFMFKNTDNFAEVGWTWEKGTHTDPTVMIAWEDNASYHSNTNKGDAGVEGSWHSYALDSDSAHVWKFRRDATLLTSHTFGSFYQGDPIVFTETRALCDSGYGDFRNLEDKEYFSNSDWGPWTQNAVYNPDWSQDHPCYYTDIISSTHTEMPHNDSKCQN